MARSAPSEISLTISSGDGDYVPPVVEDADDDDLASIATGTATPGATTATPAAVGTTGQTAPRAATPAAPAPSPPVGAPDDYAAREQKLMAAMAAAGHPIVKVGGKRTAAEQAALYAKGRSAPGPVVTEKTGAPGDESRHQAGTATDFAFVGPDGQPSYDPSHPWDTLGRMAKVHGFEWGGDWTTLKDQGHVQAPGGPSGVPSPGPGPAGSPSPAQPKVEDATPQEVAQVGAASDADLAAIGQKPPETPLPLYRQVLDPIAESLPMIGGATGGMLAGTAATTLGPAGTATGAVLGAGAGGWVGEQLRQLYRSTVGIEPHPDWTTSVSKTLAAGNTQMTSEMVGQGLGAALAARAVGKPGAKAAQAASDRYGLRLSAPEQSGSAIGKNLQKGFTYLSGLAKMATDNARKVGDANAVRAVREALDGLTSHDLTARETGEAAQRGVKAGLKGLREGPIGQLYQQTKKNGPNIDLRPQIDTLFRLFKAEGTPVAVRRKLLKLLPKPLNQVTAPFRYNSTEPYHVTFEQAAKLRTRLGLSGRKYLETLGSDATSLATQWYGSLSQALKDAHPDFGTVSNLWRDARTSLTAPFIRRIMRESPDVVVKALGPSPQTASVAALRDTFLRLAAHNGPATPEADAGIMAWQALRKKWFDRWVLRDGAGNPDPAGMLERMQRMNGTLHEMYGTDPLGRRVMDTATEIATALKRRVVGPSAETAGRIRSGEIYAALTSTILKGAATTAEALALTEATPGFVTWLMHQPRVATAFVRALTGKASIQTSQVLSRTMAAYLMGNGEPPPEPTSGFEPHIEDDHNAPEAPEPGQVRSPGVPGTPPGAVPTTKEKPAYKGMGMLPDVDLTSWKGLNTPLLPQIAQAAHAIAMKATEPNMADQLQYEASNRLLPGLGTMGVMYKGFKAGVVEGVGDLASTLTSPIGLALSLTGLGPESKALKELPTFQKLVGLPEVQALTRAVHIAAGAGFYGHGLETITHAKTWTERAQGVIEAATGAVGAVHGLTPHPGATAATPTEPPPPRPPAGTGTPAASPPGTPAAPTMAPTHPMATHAVTSAEHLADMDAQFQAQYHAWLNDPRHNQYPGQTPTRPRFKDPANPDLEDVAGRAVPRSDADVAEAKAKLDAAREAARVARGEPPKERTAKPRESLLSERGSTGRMWLDPEAPGEPPRPTATKDRELPKQPRWVRSSGEGGFWVMPSGQYAAARTPQEAQAILKAQGVDPFSKSGKAPEQGLTAPTPAAPPPLAPTDINRPWTDAPAGGPDMPGFYSTIQRIAHDIPAKGIKPRRLLAQVEQFAPEESEFRMVSQFVRDHIDRYSEEKPITKEDLQVLLDNTKMQFKTVTRGGRGMPYQEIGRPVRQVPETVTTPDLGIDQNAPFPSFDEWLPTRHESYARPENRAWVMQEYERMKERDTYQRRLREQTYHMPVTRADGTTQTVVIAPSSYNPNEWMVTLPEGVGEGGPPEMHPDHREGQSIILPTFEEAEAWARGRLEHGGYRTSGSGTSYGGYAVPGPGGGPQQHYYEQLFALPSDVPGNQMPGDDTTTGHFTDTANVLAHARGQEYQLPDPNAPLVPTVLRYDVKITHPDGRVVTIPGTLGNQSLAIAERYKTSLDEATATMPEGPEKPVSVEIVPIPGDPVPSGRPLQGSLVDEVQSDPHEKATKIRNAEIKRLRDEKAAEIREAHPELTRAEARARAGSKSAFSKQVPKDFGYQSPDYTARHAAIDAEREAAAIQFNEARTRLREAAVAVQEAEEAYKRRVIDEAYPPAPQPPPPPREEGDRWEPAFNPEGVEPLNYYDVQLRGRLSFYHTPQGEPIYRLEQLSPEQRAEYDKAIAVLQRLSSEPVSQDPGVQAASEAHAQVAAEREAARTRLTEIQQRQVALQREEGEKIPAYPYRESWDTMVAKKKIYEAATDPRIPVDQPTFLGVVGGEENAQRYNFINSISRIRFNPENGRLEVFDLNGSPIGQHEGRLQVGQHPNYARLAEVLGDDLGERMHDAVQDYWDKPEAERLTEPAPVVEAPPRTRPARPPRRNDEPLPIPARIRRAALERWEESERQYAAENERNAWDIEEVEVPTEEVDEEHEDTIAYREWEAQQRVQRELYGDRSATEQPALPGLPQQWEPSPPVEPVYETETKYVAVNPDMEYTTDEDSHNLDERTFDTRHEADRYIDNTVDDYMQSWEGEEPDDDELWEHWLSDDEKDDVREHHAEGYLDDEDEDEDRIRPGTRAARPEHFPTFEGADLAGRGKGMLTFYDQAFKSRIEKLLRPFGGGELQRTPIPGQGQRDTYAWVAYLTPEMRAKIAKAGFSLMALALALRDTDAPEEIKNRLFRLAVLQARRKSPSTETPGHLGKSTTPSQLVGGHP